MKFLAGLLILTIPLGCSNNSSKSGTLGLISTPNEEVYEMDNAAVDDLVYDSPNQNVEIEQKLIKESYLAFETKDLDQTYKAIVAAINKYNGYIQDDSANKGYSRISRQLTVRIPTNNFQSTIDDISQNVEYFDTKRISSKDVTEEFVDLEARLKAKRTLEERYLELLKKAQNVKEVLEIERELSSIREEIEAKQGRLKYLQNKVSLSTINIEFYKLTAESKVPISYGSKMWKAIVSGFDGLSAFFLGILYIWPFIIFLIIVFFLIKRWINKRRNK